MKIKKRKSIKEIRAFERSAGFYDCLEIFEKDWRKLAWTERGSDKEAFLWDIIERVIKEGSKLDAAYKEFLK